MFRYWPALIFSIVLIFYGELLADGNYNSYHLIVIIVAWVTNVYFLIKNSSKTVKIETDTNIDEVKNYNTLISESSISNKMIGSELNEIDGNVNRLKEIISDAVVVLSSSFTTLSTQSNTAKAPHPLFLSTHTSFLYIIGLESSLTHIDLYSFVIGSTLTSLYPVFILFHPF